MLRVITSTSAAARVAEAERFVSGLRAARPALIVAASRGAADDLARRLATRRGATFGLLRMSVSEAAARAAAGLVGNRRPSNADGGAEALATRVVFDALAANDLDYFQPVAAMPGFPRALTRTLHELRLAGVEPQALAPAGAGGVDLGRLLARVEDQLREIAADDWAERLRRGTRALASGQAPWAAVPLVLLDVPVGSRAEEGFVAALLGGSPDALVTIPDGDPRAVECLLALGAHIEKLDDAGSVPSDLSHLRRFVFTSEDPPVREAAGDVRLFSAPGEGRESVEIVRRVLDEASRGVPFDEMAVFLRAPRHYLGLLEHACARAGVPAYFERGTRRVDPAGRAFVALLSCAVEGLSAKRFDEYLSLGQVPRAGEGVPAADPAPARDDVAARFLPADDDDAEPDRAAPPSPPVDSDEDAVVAGALRSPWKWEELILESAVVGGRTRADGKDRWRRRLDGLDGEYRIKMAELLRDEPESPRIMRLERDLRNLAHLRAFALPLVEILADWPETATWGEWLERFTLLAGRALHRPGRVVEILATLRPMAAVGPVGLKEARDVLHERLATVDWAPPPYRYGRLFVGTPHQARGRTFRVVFVPGLAERIVPQRLPEDPLLQDAGRIQVGHSLVTRVERGGAERLLLKLAIGAATERVYISYPRMDVAETRARVPSFYALDVVRAMTGRVPDHRVLAAQAAEEADASLGWPAPSDPAGAIDDLEHDLAVLKPLLDARDRPAVKGRAHYMLGLNQALRRSVRSRWARGQKAWSPADGLVKAGPGIARAIEVSRLIARPYSLSALQRFATCPYQFLLATIHRIEPREEPEPLVRMDPLTRGSLFHAVQAEFYRTLQRRGALPVTPETQSDAIAAVDEALDRIAEDYAEKLAPAIDRVWRDEVAELRRDLGIWVQKIAQEETWIPEYFEFSFGLSDAGRDPRSLPSPVTIDGGFKLRGSVDLIEHDRTRDVYRITDHKTGKNRATRDLIVGGGTVLQPLLYSLAVAEGLGRTVESGRLFYCTTAGGFQDHNVEVNDYTRRQGLEVLAIVDRAVERGFLPAAPAARACAWCDFRPVCGPREEERLGRKAREPLADLEALRSMR